MATVFFHEEYRDLVDKLAREKPSFATRPIFSTLLDLGVFCALLGYHENRRREVPPQQQGNAITESAFLNLDKESVVFLLALQEKKTGDILREKSETECWDIFQDYMNGGFEVLQEWFVENPHDGDLVDTILSKIQLIAVEDNVDKPDMVDPGELEW
ncbi:MAG: hypothetical protein VX935_12025 [Pseudomonadota bacterium]|jgi:dnd system-associated protein 4|nr:hypothetical protein [Pseudomonadota bacterium]